MEKDRDTVPLYLSPESQTIRTHKFETKKQGNLLPKKEIQNGAISEAYTHVVSK
jgi:hypothetical protein